LAADWRQRLTRQPLLMARIVGPQIFGADSERSWPPVEIAADA
jgi:hypothetical protein